MTKYFIYSGTQLSSFSNPLIQGTFLLRYDPPIPHSYPSATLKNLVVLGKTTLDTRRVIKTDHYKILFLITTCTFPPHEQWLTTTFMLKTYKNTEGSHYQTYYMRFEPSRALIRTYFKDK